MKFTCHFIIILCLLPTVFMLNSNSKRITPTPELYTNEDVADDDDNDTLDSTVWIVLSILIVVFFVVAIWFCTFNPYYPYTYYDVPPSSYPTMVYLVPQPVPQTTPKTSYSLKNIFLNKPGVNKDTFY